MNRRDLFKNGGKTIALATLAPSLFSQDGIIPNCVYTKRPPAGQTGPTPNIITCGDSCANEGMYGHYPNCWYPQYLNLNQNLANATASVRSQTAHMVWGRTITQSQWNTFNYYNQQLNAHLSVNQTTIHDKLRIQQLSNLIYQGPTQAEVTYAEGWANGNGFDPGTIGNLVASSGAPVNLPNPDLHQQIMQLPNADGMDYLSDWIFLQTTAVTVPTNGICQFVDPQKLIDTGLAMMNLGAGVGVWGQYLGQASQNIGDLAGGTIGIGVSLWIVGELCRL